jgi:aminoglycoside 2'-N-acetyltransferase I
MTESPQIAILPRTHLSLQQEQDIIALCSRAYEQDFSDLLDSFEGATHVLAYHDRQLVSHALWIPRTLIYQGTPLHSAYVEAVATEPRYQGRGYASHVLRALAAAITGFDIGALSPSDPAFYTRIGWEQWRGPLAVATESGIMPTPDGSVMIFRLPNTPALDLHATLIAPWREGDIW